MRRIANSLSILIVLLYPHFSYAENIHIEFKVDERFNKYRNVLVNPSEFVLASQNAGLAIIKTHPILIVDASTVKIQNSTVQVVADRGNAVDYMVNVKIASLVNFNIPVNLNLSKLKFGILEINVLLPSGVTLPAELYQKIKSKIVNTISMQYQKPLLDYLDSLHLDPGSVNYTTLLTDYYNLSITGAIVSNNSPDFGQPDDHLTTIKMIISVLLAVIIFVYLTLRLKKLLIAKE